MQRAKATPNAAQTPPKRLRRAARASMRVRVAAMVDFWNAGVPTLDYANNIRQVALDKDWKTPLLFRVLCPPISTRCFAKGLGLFVGWADFWVALSGDPEDIYKTDAAMKKLFPDNQHLHRWLDMAADRIAFQGLPARICGTCLGDRHRARLMFSEMVRSGALKAPIVIGRDHLDAGSVASPNRETESMKDGSDAVSDWPLLNALIHTAANTTKGGTVGPRLVERPRIRCVASCGRRVLRRGGLRPRKRAAPGYAFWQTKGQFPPRVLLLVGRFGSRQVAFYFCDWNVLSGWSGLIVVKSMRQLVSK